jgi:hypothetical protein
LRSEYLADGRSLRPAGQDLLGVNGEHVAVVKGSLHLRRNSNLLAAAV